MSMAKDPRRIFTDADKVAIVERQGGRCNDCGQVLGGEIAHHFHHVVPHAQGGLTTRENGIAVCVDCHGVRHDADIWPVLEHYQRSCDPRFAFQTRELFKLCDALRRGGDKQIWAAEICMGGGKTRWSLQAAQLVMAKRNLDCTVVLAPSREIAEGYIRELKTIDPNAAYMERLYKYENGVLAAPPTNRAIVVTTYQRTTGQLNRVLKAIHSYKEDTGWRFCLVCDEVHHAHEKKQWGQIGLLEELADFTLVQTGTPFRSDEGQIAVIPYHSCPTGVSAVPVIDTSYTIRQGINDRTVRQVAMRWVDGPLTYQVRENGNIVEREADCIAEVPEDLQSAVIASNMLPGMPLWETLYVAANEHLQSVRARPYSQYGKGLIVVPPGKDGTDTEAENRRIDLTVAAWKRDGVCDQFPVKVTSEDNNRDEIFRFRQDNGQLWLAAINMVSEGVNIPQLWVLALCRAVSSRMLFNQLVGRVMRTTTGGREEEIGRVILPRTTAHLEFARELESTIPPEVRIRSCSTCNETPCICDRKPFDTTVRYDDPEPRIVAAVFHDATLDGGNIREQEVEEFWCQEGAFVLATQGRKGCEVRLGMDLKCWNEIRIQGRSKEQMAAADAARHRSEVAKIWGSVELLARHANRPVEDVRRDVLRLAGVASDLELNNLPATDLQVLRERVNELVLAASKATNTR